MNTHTPNHTKKRLGLAGGFLVLLTLTGCTGNEKVATIGDYTLTKDDFYTQMATEPYTDGFTIGEVLLEQTILKEVFETRYGKKVTKAQTEAAMDKLKANYETEADFLKNLEDNNMTAAQLTDDIRFSQLIDQAFYEFEPVEEETLKKAYDEMIPVGVRLAHILVKDEKTAQKVLKELDEGASFKDLVKTYSLDEETKELGGEYTLIKGYFVPEVEEAILSLEKDAITTEPVKTDYGYHIIQSISVGEKGTFEEEVDTLRDVHYQALNGEDPTFYSRIMRQVLERAEKDITIHDKAMNDLVGRIIKNAKKKEKDHVEALKAAEVNDDDVVYEEYFPMDGMTKDGYAFTDMIESDD